MSNAIRQHTPEALGEGLLALLRAAIACGITPAAQLEVGTDKGPLLSLHAGQQGWSAYAPPGVEPKGVIPQTPFDLASVTKPLAVGLLAGRALALGLVRLDTRLGDMIGPQVPPDKAGLRLDDLLAHRAGFTNWLPLYEQMPSHLRGTLAGRDWTRQEVLKHPLEAPPGQRERYTDLGYILLAWALEAVMGARFDALFAEHVAKPLELEHTRFVARAHGDIPLEDAVWSEVIGWRGGLVRGEVHDDNTAAMGGVSGHAGLFAPASEVGQIARALLLAESGDDTWLSAEVIKKLWSRDSLLPGTHHLLGWDSPSGDISGAGLTCTREQTVGHLGFTGTSLWIDRARRAYVVLLTSRVHPTRDAPRIRALRPLVHDTAWALVDRANP